MLARVQQCFFCTDWGGNHHGLESLAQLLGQKNDFRIINPDLPGYDQSERLHVPHTLENYANTLDLLCQELSLAPVILVGHSYGASVAIMLAARYPKRVDRLILFNPVVPMHAKETQLSRLTYKTLSRLPEPLRKLLFQNHFIIRIEDNLLFRTHSKSIREHMLQEDFRVAHTTANRVEMENFQSLFTTPLLTLASKIAAQTLIITGSTDRLATPESIKTLAKVIPASQVQIVQNAGHFLPVEEPAKAAELVDSFLKMRHTVQ